MDCESSVNLRRQGLVRSEQVLAYRANDVVTRTDFSRQVLAFYRALRSRPEQRICLWLDSGVDFLASVLALAMAGKRTVMPHNLQPQSARELQPHFDALIVDTPMPDIDCPQWSPLELMAVDGDDSGVDDNALQQPAELLLFTSGSTGAPEPVMKTLADFESEITSLQRVFAAQVTTTPVVGTVSHQHIYGLLHLLLWPLERGAGFMDASCHYPEILADYAAQFDELVLVSSPTHLNRLPVSDKFVATARSFKAVFSSGGLLSAEASQAMANVCGGAPLEILGSTETGGVAWRCQSDSSLWQPLPGVSITTNAEQSLVVCSAHLGHGGHFTMGDCIELQADGRFLLRGRADQVVKVEGKRLSLTELEKRLCDQPWVREARAAVLRGKRDEVVVLASLTTQGNDELHKRGKRAINQLLRASLVQFFEAPLLPRRWRYVVELPRNSQGKLPQSAVLNYFQQEDE
ncbi:AMP-binding protein [Gilvimarinus chinensis]|uniref:AMP-binding protein n=1 Tax=Gilvimarinus chinensis TaxID=396005 RepID=UPI00035E023C|nr:AMP-binding protein [Gilvimarinus chinensis]